MTLVLLFVLGFAAGSLPFSVWIGRLALKADIRDYGDGNPGTFNVIRAGGVRWGGLALLLDFLKGALPVALANFVFRLDGPALAAVAIAPPLGHAFSPWLRFKGGKAIASTAGAWCGLTIWEGPTVGGIMLGFWYAFLNESGWVVILTMFSALAYFVLTGLTQVMLLAWCGHLLVFVYKHRSELRRSPTLRAWYREVRLPWH